MNDAQANRALIEAMPEAEFEYRSWKRLFGDEEPGATVVYESVLKPLLVRIAQNGSKADLRRVLGFLESLAGRPESYAHDLVAYTVYDLCREDEAFKRARRYMGPETERICDRVIDEELG